MGRLTLQGTRGKENDFVKLYRDALEQLLADVVAVDGVVRFEILAG